VGPPNAFLRRRDVSDSLHPPLLSLPQPPPHRQRDTRRGGAGGGAEVAPPTHTLFSRASVVPACRYLSFRP
jgi:hypothetical protein